MNIKKEEDEKLMENHLFVMPYSENDEDWILVYKGNSNNNNKYYSAMYIGNVNLNQRFFIKGDKYLQKVVDQKNQTITLEHLKDRMYKLQSYFKDQNDEMAPIGSDIIKVILSSVGKYQEISESSAKILYF